MQKSSLLRFIELYNLSGTVEKVKLVSDGTNLKAKIVTDDKSLAGCIEYKNLPIEAGEYAVHDTAQLKKMLSIFDDTLNIGIDKVNGRNVSFSFKDKTAESLYMLADLSVIPRTVSVPSTIAFDLELTLDDSFMERFIRAKSALLEAETFTIMMNDKGAVEVIVGHSNINSNRIKLVATPVGVPAPKKDITFNANYFKDILLRNRGTPSVLKINTDGIGHVNFTCTDYVADYYLLKTAIK